METPLEIERKFLIRRPEEALLQAQPGAERIRIVQTYLEKDAHGANRRVRLWEQGRECKYILTKKTRVTEITRIEDEEEISEERYTQLLAQSDPKRRPIEKVRYRIPGNGHLYEIDLFPFWKKQAYLEIELKSEKQKIVFPTFVMVLREVTADAAYTNRALALRIPEEEV